MYIYIYIYIYIHIYKVLLRPLRVLRDVQAGLPRYDSIV